MSRSWYSWSIPPIDWAFLSSLIYVFYSLHAICFQVLSHPSIYLIHPIYPLVTRQDLPRYISGWVSHPSPCRLYRRQLHFTLYLDEAYSTLFFFVVKGNLVYIVLPYILVLLVSTHMHSLDSMPCYKTHTHTHTHATGYRRVKFM